MKVTELTDSSKSKFAPVSIIQVFGEKESLFSVPNDFANCHQLARLWDPSLVWPDSTRSGDFFGLIIFSFFQNVTLYGILLFPKVRSCFLLSLT